VLCEKPREFDFNFLMVEIHPNQPDLTLLPPPPAQYSQPITPITMQSDAATGILTAAVGTKIKKMVTVPISIETIDGIEWLTFHYTAKGDSISHAIRIDVDSVTEITSEFKLFNCIYPKALCSREDYTGNRYEYETTGMNASN
jgi:hypothetical protein